MVRISNVHEDCRCSGMGEDEKMRRRGRVNNVKIQTFMLGQCIGACPVGVYEYVDR